MYLNDELGDCVIAARYHRIGQLTALAKGKAFVAAREQLLADYHRVGGYVVGNEATDQGCDMVTNNNDGVSVGYADGSKDLGWVVLDGTNFEELKAAVWLFEGSVDLGIELPDAWVSPFPSNGGVWDVAGDPNPNNGHCVQVIDYDEDGVWVSTWGIVVKITKAALAKYLSKSAWGEAYLHLSPDQITAGNARAPNGVAWEDLVADFDRLGGRVPSPSPLPPAPPAPSPPPPGPTLAQAVSWVKNAFTRMSSAQIPTAKAKKVATDALIAHWPGPKSG
jgi:hypothetical protein